MSPEEGGAESAAPAGDPAEAPALDETKSGAASGNAQLGADLAAHDLTPPPTPVPAIPPVVDVDDLDWDCIGAALDPEALRARMRATVEQLEALLDSPGGVQMLFDDQREGAADRAL